MGDTYYSQKDDLAFIPLDVVDKVYVARIESVIDTEIKIEEINTMLMVYVLAVEVNLLCDKGI